MSPRNFLMTGTFVVASFAGGCSAHVPPQDAVVAERGGSTVVVLVRHAEKAGPSGDVPLSAAGEARAASLAQALAGARIDGVITTTLQRTRQTAAPLARARGIEPLEIAPNASVPTHAAAIADAVKGKFAGRSVLIVGHSNTVPAIIRALGGPSIPDLCDSEYQRMFTLVFAPGDSTRLIRSNYGVPDPLAASGCPTMR